MKKARKGFTLVELLIVVAILATLTATMMVSMRGATAKAKAASIAANLESCHTAAMLYYAASGDKDLSEVSADAVLTTYLKTWDKLKGSTASKDAIVYTAAGKGVDGWVVNVDFSKDSESKDIAQALHNMKGYSAVGLIALVDNDIDLLGLVGLAATPAYADGETPAASTNTNSGKLYMKLITGEIFEGTTSTTTTTTES